MAEQRIRSALFLDFDNILGGLLESSEEVKILTPEANYLTGCAREWLRILETECPQIGKRELIVKRVYMNPAGEISISEHDNGKKKSRPEPLRKYIRSLELSGFEVIQCPPLTTRGKTAADMRIAVDVVKYLYDCNQIDEFIIASGDADFTPVIKIISAKNRLSMIASTNFMSHTYRKSANKCIERDAFRDILRNAKEKQSVETSQLLQVRKLISLVQEMLDCSDTPVLLTEIAKKCAAKELAIGHDDYSMDEYLILKLLLVVRAKAPIVVKGDYAWNSEKHEEPLQIYSQARKALPKPIKNIYELAELPEIDNGTWWNLSNVLSQEVNEMQRIFNLDGKKYYDNAMNESAKNYEPNREDPYRGYDGSIFDYYDLNLLKKAFRDRISDDERTSSLDIDDGSICRIIEFVTQAYNYYHDDTPTMFHDITGAVSPEDIRRAIFYSTVKCCLRRGQSIPLYERMALAVWLEI